MHGRSISLCTAVFTFGGCVAVTVVVVAAAEASVASAVVVVDVAVAAIVRILVPDWSFT
jgi:hypothetical protein